MKQWLLRAKFWSAFQKFALIFSFSLNVIFLLILISLVKLLIPINSSILAPLVSDLNISFEDMNKANIVYDVPEGKANIQLGLDIQKDITVTLTEDVPLVEPITFMIGDLGVINGTAALTLRQGTKLPIALNLPVLISDTATVDLLDPISIPLKDTELGPPFVRLQERFGPLDAWLHKLPPDNDDVWPRIKAAFNSGNE